MNSTGSIGDSTTMAFNHGTLRRSASGITYSTTSMYTRNAGRMILSCQRSMLRTRSLRTAFDEYVSTHNPAHTPASAMIRIATLSVASNIQNAPAYSTQPSSQTLQRCQAAHSSIRPIVVVPRACIRSPCQAHLTARLYRADFVLSSTLDTRRVGGVAPGPLSGA